MAARESPDNWGVVCAIHTPSPGAYAHVAPDVFVGHAVKRAFGTRQGRTEHMWVRIDAVLPDGALTGLLDNDPVLDCGLVCGDRVTVRLEDIEAVEP